MYKLSQFDTIINFDKVLGIEGSGCINGNGLTGPSIGLFY